MKMAVFVHVVCLWTTTEGRYSTVPVHTGSGRCTLPFGTTGIGCLIFLVSNNVPREANEHTTSTTLPVRVSTVQLQYRTVTTQQVNPFWTLFTPLLKE